MDIFRFVLLNCVICHVYFNQTTIGAIKIIGLFSFVLVHPCFRERLWFAIIEAQNHKQPVHDSTHAILLHKRSCSYEYNYMDCTALRIRLLVIPVGVLKK